MPNRMKVVNNVTYRVESRPVTDETDSAQYWLGDDGSTMELTNLERASLSQ